MTSIWHGLRRAACWAQARRDGADTAARADDEHGQADVLGPGPTAFGAAPTVSASSMPKLPKIPQPTGESPRSPARSRAPASPRPVPGSPALQSDLRYGVEVEHQGLSFRQVAEVVASTVGGGDLDHASEIDAADGRKWRLDRDAGGVELVTPVLQGSEDLAVLQEIVTKLRDAGGRADYRAGLHVHIDAARFSPKEVQGLIALMARNEHWLYPVWGVHERRRTQWCAAIKSGMALACTQLNGESRMALATAWGANRYLGLNLLNYFRPLSNKHTIEFRYLNGTLDALAIGCAVGFYTAVAEYALQGESLDDKPWRASLPAMLRELKLDRDDPIAQHLYGLLQTRIETGWNCESLGPMPDFATILRDDDFVSALCLLLDAEDEPAQVAKAVQLVRDVPSAVLQERVCRAADLVSKIEYAVDAGLGVVTAMQVLEQKPGCESELARALVSMRCRPWHANELMHAVHIMLPHLGRGSEHLQFAIEVARKLEDNWTQKRIRRLEYLLEWPESELELLHEVLESFKFHFSQGLGRRLATCQEAGVDITVLARRLDKLGSLLRDRPEDCVDLALDHPHLDLRALSALMKQNPLCGWRTSDALQVGYTLLTWQQSEGGSLDTILPLLALVPYARNTDRVSIARQLMALTPDTLVALGASLRKVSEDFGPRLLPAALKVAQQDGDFSRLCTAAALVGCIPEGPDFDSFVARYSDAALHTLAAKLDAAGLPMMNSSQRFRALQALADYRGTPAGLGIALRIAAAAVTPREAQQLRDLYERYPGLDMNFIVHGLVELRDYAIDHVPGGLSTRDEGLLLSIMSRSRPASERFGFRDLSDIGLPSMNVDAAERDIQFNLAFGHSLDKLMLALRAHPNPHGFWGTSSLVHWAPHLSADRRDGGARMLMALYDELGRQGVDLEIETTEGRTPRSIVQAHYAGEELTQLMQIFDKYQAPSHRRKVRPRPD